jgi:hypothetical protein
MTNITELSTAQLLAVYNHYADISVHRFATTAVARTRVAKLLKSIDAPECKAIAAVLAPVEAPDADWTPADVGFGDKIEDDERAAAKAEKAPRKARLEPAIHARVKAAAKPAAKPVEPAAKAPGGAKATILAMIAAKGGTTERDVAKALGWPRAGGTISRAIAAAPFAVVKTKGDDGRTVYSRA